MRQSRKALVLDAFEEFRVTRQISTGQGEAWLNHALTYYPSRMVGDQRIGPSTGFVNGELGFGDLVGPNLEQTMERLPETNRRHIERLVRRSTVPTYAPPPRSNRKRESRYSRKAKYEQRFMQALLDKQAA